MVRSLADRTFQVRHVPAEAVLRQLLRAGAAGQDRAAGGEEADLHLRAGNCFRSPFAEFANCWSILVKMFANYLVRFRLYRQLLGTEFCKYL